MSADSKTVNEKWLLVATILPSAVAFLLGTLLSIAQPAIQTEFNAPTSQVLWVINAYQLFLSALILLGGSLGDHFGRNRIFLIGISGFTFASLLCGFAPTIEWLIIFRALQGVGGALMVPGSLAILSAVVAPERRGVTIGLWATFTTLATMVAIPIGGFIVRIGLWRGAFLMTIPFCLIGLYALVRYVPESRDEDAQNAKLDYWGALLITIALAGVTYGISEINTLDTFGLFITLGGGILAFILFLGVELGNRHALVPFYLFKNRTFSGTNILTLFLYGALGAAFTFLPLNLIQIQGYPEDIAGIATLPVSIGIALLGRWSGKLVDRFGARPLLTIGPILTGIGFGLLGLVGLTSGTSDYWTTFFPGILFVSIGMGLVVAPLTTAVMGSVPVSASGTASGINNAVSRVAGVLAVAIFGTMMINLFTTSLNQRAQLLPMDDESRIFLMNEAPKLAETQIPPNLADDLNMAVDNAISLSFIEAYRVVMLIMAGMAIVGGIFAFLVIDRRPT